MATLKGARIMVDAPNSATNKVLTSPGVISACRQQATGIAQRMYSQIARSSENGGAKKRRYPVTRTMGIATSFKGTVRGGAAVKGQQWGMRKSDVEDAMGKDVEWQV